MNLLSLINEALTHSEVAAKLGVNGNFDLEGFASLDAGENATVSIVAKDESGKKWKITRTGRYGSYKYTMKPVAVKEDVDGLFEATDTKGAVEYLQNAFNKAGLTITVKGSGNTIKCSGSLNRVKFNFIITLVNGKLNADFSGMNIDSMINPPSLSIGKDFRAGVQKFIVNADQAIAEIRVAKTFLMRLTRVLERVTVVAQKNKVSESKEDDLQTLKNLRLSLSELQNPSSGRWSGESRPKGNELEARIEDRKTKIAALEKKLGVK